MLIRSIQQLGARSPSLVHGYLVEMLKTGAAVREQEELRRQVGFRPRKGEG